MIDLTKKVDDRVYDLDYIKKSQIKKENIFYILNNIALSNIQKYFGVPKDNLFFSMKNNTPYLFTDAKFLYKKQIINTIKKSVNLNKFNKDLEIIRMNLDYYSIKTRLYYFANKDKDFFKAYINFMCFYFLFDLFSKKLKLSKEYKHQNICPLPISYYSNFLNKSKGFYVNKQKYESQDIKTIIKKRKEDLKKDTNKFFLYYFVDLFHNYRQHNKDLKILFNNYIYSKHYFLSEFLDLISKFKFEIYKNKNIIDSINNYNNYLYFDLKTKDEKLKYWYNLAPYLGKPHFTKKDIIDNYPMLSITILNIQKELNIKVGGKYI